MFSFFKSLIFSFLNIQDPITFMNVDNTTIKRIETFVQTQLPQILSHWKSSGKISSLNNADYFGEVGALNPSSFEFVFGDKLRILEASNYVKKMVNEKGFQYFAVQKILPSNTYENKINQYSFDNEPNFPFLLKKLVSSATQNLVRHKNGYRYDGEIQSFSMVFRLLSGPLAYETLQKNLSCTLPSLPSVNRYIYKSNYRAVEGALRCDELLQYLEERNLEKVVTLSEDATRIVGRVQYDSYSNQIVGFALPINKKSGLPIPLSFPARSMQEIIGHFENENEISPLVNVIMAKPVCTNSIPAFCLLLYGTNNKYTAEDVCKRWITIIEKLKSLGITVISFSSDSDPRYNTAMKKLSQLGQMSKTSSFLPWFSCGDWENKINTISPSFIQDTPHILTKLRNLILKTAKSPNKLPFGNYFIKQSHLKKIIVCFSKDVHNLTPMILDPVDKQNYGSAERMCDKRVTDLLRNSLNGSDGTIKFLEIMKYVNESFMDESLNPLERVYKLWYSVFILRMWREFINSKKKSTLKHNFLTLNSYTCIEMNAHSIVLCMAQLKKNNLPQLFLPKIFNSQHCESLFRQIRSISSTFSTITNCTIKEFGQRISKIQLQSDVMSKIGSNFVFSRLDRNKSNNLKLYDMPTLTEIYSEIEKSKHDAIRDAIALCLIRRNKVNQFDFACKIKPHIQNCKTIPKKRGRPSAYMKHSMRRVLHLNRINLKNFANQFIEKEVGEKSAYVELYHNHEINRRMIVKKTPFCWLLRGDNERVSSDRLQRVRIGASKKWKKVISTMHNEHIK